MDILPETLKQIREEYDKAKANLILSGAGRARVELWETRLYVAEHDILKEDLPTRGRVAQQFVRALDRKLRNQHAEEQKETDLAISARRVFWTQQGYNRAATNLTHDIDGWLAVVQHVRDELLKAGAPILSSVDDEDLEF